MKADSPSRKSKATSPLAEYRPASRTTIPASFCVVVLILRVRAVPARRSREHRLQAWLLQLLSIRSPLTGQSRVVVEITRDQTCHQHSLSGSPAEAQHLPLARR